jgi:hypothetical protein
MVRRALEDEEDSKIRNSLIQYKGSLQAETSRTNPSPGEH